jgi:hypothetical protein
MEDKVDNPAFEGAEINGKRFPFIRVSVANEPKIINRFLPHWPYIGRILDHYFPLTANKRAWKKVRRIAFEKDWKWKYFGIIPKELRCSEIKIQVAGGIQVDFFAYVAEARKEFSELIPSVNNTRTVTESIK